MGYEAIASAVEIDGGLKRLPMWLIKSHAAPYRDRLSEALCKEIAAELGRRGLMTLPSTLPTDEREWVIVMKTKSALGEAVTVARKAVFCSKLEVPMPLDTHTKYPRLARQVR